MAPINSTTESSFGLPMQGRRIMFQPFMLKSWFYPAARVGITLRYGLLLAARKLTVWAGQFSGFHVAMNKIALLLHLILL